MVVNPFIALIATVINLLWWGIFIWFVLSLMIQFNVVNRYNPVVSKVYSVLEQVIDPLLRPIRKVIPLISGMDFSPLILILGLEFIKNAVIYYG